jgi:hypothetical protein
MSRWKKKYLDLLKAVPTDVLMEVYKRKQVEQEPAPEPAPEPESAPDPAPESAPETDPEPRARGRKWL